MTDKIKAAISYLAKTEKDVQPDPLIGEDNAKRIEILEDIRDRIDALDSKWESCGSLTPLGTSTGKELLKHLRNILLEAKDKELKAQHLALSTIWESAPDMRWLYPSIGSSVDVTVPWQFREAAVRYKSTAPVEIAPRQEISRDIQSLLDKKEALEQEIQFEGPYREIPGSPTIGQPPVPSDYVQPPVPVDCVLPPVSTKSIKTLVRSPDGTKKRFATCCEMEKETQSLDRGEFDRKKFPLVKDYRNGVEPRSIKHKPLSPAILDSFDVSAVDQEEDILPQVDEELCKGTAKEGITIASMPNPDDLAQAHVPAPGEKDRVVDEALKADDILTRSGPFYRLIETQEKWAEHLRVLTKKSWKTDGVLANTSGPSYHLIWRFLTEDEQDRGSVEFITLSDTTKFVLEIQKKDSQVLTYVEYQDTKNIQMNPEPFLKRAFEKAR